MWIYIVIIGLAIMWLLLGIFEWKGTKKAYEHEEPLSKEVSAGWGILGLIGLFLIIVTSFFNIWQLPINKKLAFIMGIVILGIGVIIMIMGLIEFRSTRRVMGQDASKLITSGIYRWSRNPQLLGTYLLIFGISIMERSGLAFLFTIIGILYYHLYTIKLEEPFLERMFGEEYRRYKSRTPRYIRVLRREGK
ncbi:MAG: isoprenylcysteine carboxylmethyltransferase family protein [Candidatus Micrarchaeota archaeon]|nr:isoprenylcysteine carboxylmethyltransferase family protein [Candidatus Micrarchaeota archaeon]